MEELIITEEELDYFTNIPDRVCEDATPYRTKNSSFEEESKGCITLEEFGIMWKKAIENDPRFI